MMDGMMAGLRNALGDRRVVPAFPEGRLARAAVHEAEETEPNRDDSSSWTAFLRYVDVHGDESERRFTCHAIEGFGEATRIAGFCHERKAFRRFRVDRIEELICAETGEVFEPVPHFERLRSTGALMVKDPVLTDVAKLLVFLAQCDSHYHPLERQALEQHVGSYCIRYNGTDRMIEDTLKGCKRLAPDGGDVLKALGRLAKLADGPSVCRFVLGCGADIIDADGHHAPQEIEWALELSGTLKAVADRK